MTQISLALSGLRWGVLTTTLLLSLTAAGSSDDDTDTLRIQVGRYITLAPTTTVAQRLPLLYTSDIRLPGSVTWLRSALQYVLKGSGFQLAPDFVNCLEIQAIFQRDVARVQRQFEQVTVLEALHALAGPAFVIRLDPVARLIAFDLAPAFQAQAEILQEPPKSTLSISSAQPYPVPGHATDATAALKSNREPVRVPYLHADATAPLLIVEPSDDLVAEKDSSKRPPEDLIDETHVTVVRAPSSRRYRATPFRPNFTEK